MDQGIDLNEFEAVDDPQIVALLELPQKDINSATSDSGKPLPAWAAKPYESQINIYSQLAGAVNNFQDDFGGNAITGGLENTIQGMYGGFGTEGQRNWWSAFRTADNKIRNELFGATLTPSEQAAYAATSISERMDPTEIRRNLQTRRDIVRKALARKTAFLRAQGYSGEAIDALAGEYAADFSAEGARAQQPPAQEQQRPPAAAAESFLDQSAPLPNVPGGGTPTISPDGSMRFSTETDARAQAETQAALDRGASVAELVAIGDKYGVKWNPVYLGKAVDYVKRGGKGATVDMPQTGYRPPNARGATAASPTGAYLTGAANALTAGTLDEIAGMAGGDAEAVQTAKELLRQEHPVASLAGEVTGAGLAMTGLAKVPGAAGKGAVALDGAYGAGYGAGESNEDRLGGAVVGGAVGAAGSWGGRKLLDRLARPKTATASPSAEYVASAEKFGIDAPLAAAGGRTSRIVDNTLSNMPGSASVMNDARLAVGRQTERAVDTVADTFGAANSPMAAGEAAQRGAKAWISKFEEVSSKAYDAIPISPKAQSTLNNTTAELERLTTIFESNPKMAEAFRSTRLERYLEALGDGSGGLSWDDLKQFRSRIGEEIGEARFSESPTKGELRALYGALSEDMRATAAAQGPQALQRFERANDLYRAGQERIDGALVKILGDDGMKSPEAAAGVLQTIARGGKSTSDLRTLAEVRRSMPAEEWGEVSGALIRLAGQPANSPGRAFSAETFVRTFDDMTEPAKNLLFGDRGRAGLRANLEEFSGVVRGLAETNALRNTSNTAGQVLTGLGFYSLGNIPALLGQMASSYGAARLMTSPRFVKWATGYTKMLNGAARAGGTPKLGKQIELLNRVAAADPTLAQDITGLRALILNAANDNVTPAIAASEPNQNRQ